MHGALRLTLGGTALAALTAFYFVVDPAKASYAPFCIFHRLTGLQCPGCGSQRMAHALLHGDIAAAWHHNALLLCMLPILVFMFWLEMVRTRRPRLYSGFYRPLTIWSFVVIITLWTIGRNIPLFCSVSNFF